MKAEVTQAAEILGLQPMLQRLHTLQAQRPADAPATLQELSLRQDLLEAIETASLDVDSVLAELANEQSELGNLRTSLRNRRDKTVSHLTTAALITGSGVGAAVSATQFTSLSTTTQNVGDGLGIGSGAASTLLSVLAARAQRGPQGSVGEVPNMLAPLLGGTPVLHSYYSPEVLTFLNSVPPGEDPALGTRLDRLMANWNKTGRLSGGDSEQRRQKVRALTTSLDTDVKVSIDELTDRIAMLGDVSGRVSLLKRDMAELMHARVAATER